MVSPALYSSSSDMWATPQDLFDNLNKEFRFGVDVCAVKENAKCKLFFSPEQDGLKQDWTGHGTAWCNPPYGRHIGDWCKKAAETATAGETTVMLVPARTDTKWFHDWMYKQPNVEIRFIKGRLKFGGGAASAPFPSMIAIFRPKA